MSIIHDTEQGTLDWIHHRLGIPTASEFNRIITPTGKKSTQWEAYMHRLIAERLLGEPVETFKGTYHTDRGNLLEADAVDFYEMNHLQPGQKITRVGFVTDDTGSIGCSPDRFIGDDTILELKCPSAAVHTGYLLNGFGSEYYPQRQGQLLICQRSVNIIMSYHPQLPPVIDTVTSDMPYQRLMYDMLAVFIETMQQALHSLASRGILPAPLPPKPVQGVDYLQEYLEE